MDWLTAGCDVNSSAAALDILPDVAVI